MVAAAATQAATAPSNDDGSADLASRLDALADQLEALRSENVASQAAIAGNTGRMARKLDDVTAQSGGDAISTVQAA